MKLAELEQHLLAVASQVPRMEQPVERDWADDSKTAAAAPKISDNLRTTAKELIRDQHTTATGCFNAAEKLYGSQFRAWEPETLWHTLDRQGVDVPLINRDKLLAAVTLTIIPAFWWEMNAFENTTMAFNNVISDHRILQEATPAQLCWSVYEAQLLYGTTTDLDEQPEFDREPEGYTAIVLNRCGYVLAPDLLSFAQPELDKLNRNGGDVSKKEVKSAWSAMKKKKLADKDFGDSPLELQLGRLAATQLYVKDRLRQYTSDLTRLV